MRHQHIHVEVKHLCIQAEEARDAFVKHNVPLGFVFYNFCSVITYSVSPEVTRLSNFNSFFELQASNFVSWLDRFFSFFLIDKLEIELVEISLDVHTLF